jgi:hypothetical protein
VSEENFKEWMRLIQERNKFQQSMKPIAEIWDKGPAHLLLHTENGPSYLILKWIKVFQIYLEPQQAMEFGLHLYKVDDLYSNEKNAQYLVQKKAISLMNDQMISTDIDEVECYLTRDFNIIYSLRELTAEEKSQSEEKRISQEQAYKKLFFDEPPESNDVK